MNNIQKFFIISLIALFLINPISAKIIVSGDTDPLHINFWDVDTIKQGADYTFIWDSDIGGLLQNNTNVNCSFFMVQAGTTNTFDVALTPNAPGEYGHYVTVGGGNFTNLGMYNVQVDCFYLPNMSISGNVLVSFEVTPEGYILKDSDSQVISIGVIFLLILGLSLMVFGFVLINRDIWAKWGGVLIIAIGLLVVYYGLIMVNLYLSNIFLTSSATGGVIRMFGMLIKTLPLIVVLLVVYAIYSFRKLLRENKKQDDGWDNNHY